MHVKSHLVAHRSSRHEESALGSEEIRHRFLEFSNGGIFAIDIVTDHRHRHGPPHRLIRTGDGIGPKIHDWVLGLH
jgi:hypothetical protein